MTTHPFTLLQFFKHPLHLTTFSLLALTTISFWITHRAWVWLTLLSGATALAYVAKIIHPVFFIPVIVLFVCHYVLSLNIHGIAKFITVALAVIISLAFGFHIMPGVDNWLLATNLGVSSNAPTLNYYWNFDKPFIGFFILGFQLHLIRYRDELASITLKTLLFFCLFLALFIFLALSLNLVSFDFKIPLITLSFLTGNLFFVVIPEEVFFRGFLQKQIGDAIDHAYGPYVANVLVSIVFAIVHYFFVASFAYISFVFVISICYGLIYQWTRAIESSIFCHFGINAVHFIFFTYPVLLSGIS